MEALPIHIRWMIRPDMPEVLAIESESFEFPWLEEDFIACLRKEKRISMAAEHDGTLVGFMLYELNKTRIHLIDFAVASKYRRRQVGTRMMEKLIRKLSVQRRNRLVVEVREKNLGAQLFFRSLGFRAVSVLHGYYDDTTEDAYVMQYRCQSESAKDFVPANRIAGMINH